MGAISSRGGRAITCLRSTAVGGVVSRIVPQHDAGTAITVTRGFADYVVTEYGVASLLGKTFQAAGRGANQHSAPGLSGRASAGGAEAILPVIFLMDWQEHYKRKLVTAEEAVKL